MQSYKGIRRNVVELQVLLIGWFFWWGADDHRLLT